MKLTSACLFKIYVYGNAPKRSEEGIGFPGAGITGICELFTIGSGNQTWVLQEQQQEEQQELLTTSTSLLFKSLNWDLNKFYFTSLCLISRIRIPLACFIIEEIIK